MEESAYASSWASRWLPILLALIPWFWIFAPLLTENQFYLSEDGVSLQVTYPLFHMLGIALQDGHLPLWTPLIGNGYPLMAEGTAGVMYPLNLLLFRYVSPFLAYQMALVVAPLVSLVTGYYCLRHRDHGRSAALAGALCFALGGYALGHLRHLNLLQGMSMLPLVLMFGERFLARRQIGDSALCAAAAAVAILAAGMECGLFIGVMLVILVLVRGGEPADIGRMIGVPLSSGLHGWPRFWGSLRLLPIVVFLAGLVAAPQLMLTQDLASAALMHGGRSAELAARGAVSTSSLLHFLAPLLHGNPATGSYSLQDLHGETLGYIGVLGLLLALISLVATIRGDRRGVFPWILLGLSLLAAMGEATPVAGLVQLIPWSVWIAYPGRFLLLSTLALSLLVPIGLEAAASLLQRRHHRWVQSIGGYLPGLALVIIALELGQTGSQMLRWIPAEEVTGSSLTQKSMPGLGSYRLLDIDHIGGADLPSRSAELVWRKWPETRALLRANYSMVQDVAVVGGVVSLPLKAYRELEVLLGEKIQRGLDGGLALSDEALKLIYFLGVRVIATLSEIHQQALIPLEPVPIPGMDTPVRLYGLEDPFPRAYLSRTLRPCSHDETLSRILMGRFASGWAPCREVDEVPEAEPDESSGAAGYFHIQARGLWFVEYRVNLLNPGFLVVRESGAPGWRSFVNGLEVDTVPVDLIHRATPVPKGEHVVRQEYQPAGMGMGLFLNLLGLLGVTLVIVISRSRAQQLEALQRQGMG